MTPKRRSLAQIAVATMAVLAAALGVLHHLASQRPPSVDPLLEDHATRGRALAVDPRDPLLVPTRSILPHAVLQTVGARRATEQEYASAADAFGRRLWLTDTWLIDEVGSTEMNLRSRISGLHRVAGGMPLWTGGNAPPTDDDWRCLVPGLHDLLDTMDARLATGSGFADADGFLAPLAVARSFAREDVETGLTALRTVVRRDLRSPRFYAIRADIEGLNDGNAGSMSPTLQLLLLLDATDAPREATAEVHRLLLTEAFTAEQQAWLVEDRSLRFQRGLSDQIRTAGFPAGRGGAAVDFARWTAWNAARPVVIALSEQFLDGWRRRDGEAMATAAQRLQRMSAAGIGTRSFSLSGHDDPLMSAKILAETADCAASPRRPGPLEMARFVAAALLHRRGTGTWPATAAEIPAALLPPDAIDPTSRWEVRVSAPVPVPRPGARFDPLSEAWAFAMQNPGGPPDTPEEIAAYARPEHRQEVLDGLMVLPSQVAFCRVGPARLCSPAVRSRVLRYDYELTPGGEYRSRWHYNINLVERLRSGESGLEEAEVAGLLHTPPRDLLRPVSSGS